MSVTYLTVPMVDINYFATCLQIQMPARSRIKDTFVFDNQVVIAVVEAESTTDIISRHYHIVRFNTPIFVDGYSYIGQYELVKDGQSIRFVIIEVTEGHYGEHSVEYRRLYGNASKVEDTYIDDDAFKKFLKDPNSGIDEGVG